MSIIDYACQMQDAKLAALRAQAAAPNTQALQQATLDAIRTVRVDALGFCCRDDVVDAIRIAWAQLEATNAHN